MKGLFFRSGPRGLRVEKAHDSGSEMILATKEVLEGFDRMLLWIVMATVIGSGVAAALIPGFSAPRLDLLF